MTSLVVIANNGDIGGGEVMLLEMVRTARNAGIETIVASPLHPSELAEIAKREGIPVEFFGGRTRLSQMWSIRRHFRNRSELLWCNGLGPSLATTGWQNRVSHIHQLNTRKHILAASLSGMRASVILVPSQVMADLLPTARVLYNWTERLSPNNSNRSATAPWILGFLGRVTLEKGMLVLLEALRILDEEDPGKYLLRIGGDLKFAPASDAPAIAKALAPISHLVEELGWVERSDFFPNIDFAVIPSVDHESFGLVVAEAMSARVPFIISENGALPEVAGPRYPFIAAVGDAFDLAQKIRSAVRMREQDPAELDGIVSAASDRWEREFSPTAGRQRFLQVLNELGLSPAE